MERAVIVFSVEKVMVVGWLVGWLVGIDRHPLTWTERKTSLTVKKKGI